MEEPLEPGDTVQLTNGYATQLWTFVSFDRQSGMMLHYPLAGHYVLSLRTGRLQGNHRIRQWRLRDKDWAPLRNFWYAWRKGATNAGRA